MKIKLLAALYAVGVLGLAQSSGVGSIWTVVSGTLQSAAVANGNGTALGVQGLSTVAITVNCSVACSGGTTITLQGSQDGSNYVSLTGLQLGTSTLASTVVNQGTTPTVWFVNVEGLQSIRASISSYSAGTITVTATAAGGALSHSYVGQAGAPWSQNITQFGGNNIATGTGVGGNGIPRVTISNDSSLAANQSVNLNQFGGSGVSLGQQVAASSIPVILPSATVAALTPPTTVTVQQSTPGSLLGKMDVVGNAGAAMDAAGQNAASPANSLLTACQFNTSPTTITSGNMSPVQCDNAGNTLVNVKASVGGGATGSAAPASAIYNGLIATTAYPAAATAGNLVGAMGDKAGRPAVVLNTVRNLVGTFSVTSTSGTASSMIAAGGANVFDDLISLTCTTETPATATKVTISDNGSGGTTYSYNLGGTGGAAGFTINFPTPLPQGTSNAAWDILNSGAITVDCNGVYAKNQ